MRNLWFKGLLQIFFVCSFLISFPFVSEAYNWTFYDGHWYALTELDTWQNEEAEAVSVGGHLATINNAFEDAWLASTFNFVSPAGVNIGYFFDSTAGIWKWASGEPVTYTNYWSNWGSYTGDHTYLHTANHPYATGWNHAYWHTDPPGAYGYLRGVIEVTTDPNNPVPEPAAMLLLGSGLIGLASARRRFKKSSVSQTKQKAGSMSAPPFSSLD